MHSSEGMEAVVWHKCHELYHMNITLLKRGVLDVQRDRPIYISIYVYIHTHVTNPVSYKCHELYHLNITWSGGGYWMREEMEPYIYLYMYISTHMSRILYHINVTNSIIWMSHDQEGGTGCAKRWSLRKGGDAFKITSSAILVGVRLNPYLIPKPWIFSNPLILTRCPQENLLWYFRRCAPKPLPNPKTLNLLKTLNLNPLPQREPLVIFW